LKAWASGMKFAASPMMRVFGGTAFAIALLAGCGTPRGVSWTDEADTIGPERAAARGYLSVEAIDPLVFTSGEPRMKGMPFLLYDDHGRYLTQVNDPYLPPVPLVPGRYIVVSELLGEELRIQVVIRESRLTRVDLNEIRRERKAFPPAPLPEVRP